MKPQFHMLMRNGKRADAATSYTPIKIDMGAANQETFALHRANGEWVVSDPITGGRVARVHGAYKGVPVAGGSMTLAEARREAVIQVQRLVSSIGIVVFNARLLTMREKYRIEA